MSETFPDVTRHAEEAAESARAMGRRVPDVLPAPTLYGVLTQLRLLSTRLAEALPPLAQGLNNSLDAIEVYDRSGAHPKFGTATATAHLERMHELATSLAEEAAAAQVAIAQQGYSDPFLNGGVAVREGQA